MPAHLVQHFHGKYLAKELDIIWGGIWWWVRLHIPNEDAFIKYIVSNGYTKIFPFALKNGYFKRYHETMAILAAKRGHLFVLQWLYTHNFGLAYELPLFAARGGYFDMLKWLYSIGMRFLDEIIFFAAIDSGDIRILRFLFPHGHPISRELYIHAVQKNNAAIIHWLSKRTDLRHIILPDKPDTIRLYGYNRSGPFVMNYNNGIGGNVLNVPFALKSYWECEEEDEILDSEDNQNNNEYKRRRIEGRVI